MAEATGLTVCSAEPMQAAALRYFEAGGGFARAVRDATGVALPPVLQPYVGGQEVIEPHG